MVGIHLNVVLICGNKSPAKNVLSCVPPKRPQGRRGTVRYKFDLIQDGMVVASVECEDEQRALADINHYAFVYGQDGLVEIKARKVKP